MKRSIYTPKTSDVISVEYDEQLQCVFVAWKNLDSDEMRPCCEAQYEAEKRYGAKFAILDLSQSKGAVKPQDQEWFDTVHYPALARDTALKKIITILPKGSIAGLSVKRYKRLGEKHGIEMYECMDMEVALEMLKEEV
jgi:thiamine monophosphate synthase